MFPENLAAPHGAGQIDVNDLVPVRFRKVECGRPLGDAGAIDQNVYFSKLTQNVIAQSF
jgi:hypothetical protein